MSERQFNGLAVKIARVRKGVKAKDLAREAQVYPTLLSHYENGRRRIPANVGERIATILGVSPSELQAAPDAGLPARVGA